MTDVHRPLTADVIVIGAGSAGGAVAERLSADDSCRVLVLEAGPDFPDEAFDPPAFYVGGHIWGENYSGVGAPVPELDWGYWNRFPLRDGRPVRLRRGRLAGGTGMINACIAVRGRPDDFDKWVAAGATGWSWDDVRPVYETVERELSVAPYPVEDWLPIQTAFAAGMCELGRRWVDDLNAPDAWDGIVGPWPQNRRNEVRQGSLPTYLRRARPRPNFELVDRAHVDRIQFDGTRAIGVRFVDRDGRSRVARADRIVLSGGTYGSPAVLLRSGVGPAEELRQLGIGVVADLPVGRGLTDHPRCQFAIRTPPELAKLGTPGVAVAARDRGWFAWPSSFDALAGRCGITFALESDDRSGTVALADADDPFAPPNIDHRYQDGIDRDEFATAMTVMGELMQTTPFADCEWPNRDGSPAEVVSAGFGTAYHPAGTCAIGDVVDPRLDVLGLSGVTVADASVFPVNTANNTNMTAFMVGERAATFLRERG